MGDRRKILFFAEAVTLAHMMRPVVLASALNPDQYEVHLACDGRYLKLFPDLQGTIHSLYSVSCKQFLAALEGGRPLYDLPTLRRYVQEDSRIINEVQPDIVVGDFRLSLAVSASLANVAYVNLTNACWSPFAQQYFPVPELPITRIFGVGIAQALFNLVRPIVFAYHRVPMNRLRRESGLRTLGADLRQVYSHADYTLYADIPGLVAMSQMPANHQVLGPIVWSPNIPHPEWWATISNAEPIIYLNLGSSGASELFPRVLEAASDLPVTVIAATAGRIAISRCPANAFITDYLPGESAVSKSRFVICNGGSPTTQQALCAGKPVLGLPNNLDQFLNMQAVASVGAGLLVRPQQATIDVIRKAIIRMLEEEQFSVAAQRLALSCDQASAESRFVEFIDELYRKPAGINDATQR